MELPLFDFPQGRTRRRGSGAKGWEMGGNRTGQKYKNEQNRDRPGSDGATRDGKGSDKSGDAATSLRMPENLEDYKGARKKLRHAVKAVVKANSDTLAKKIVQQAQGGDARGTETMLSLIDKKKPGKEPKKKKRDGPSWAELLVSEPEWDEEEDERKASQQVSELAS